MIKVIISILNKEIHADVALEAIKFILEIPALPAERIRRMAIHKDAVDVNRAFTWDQTPQGIDFWERIFAAPDVGARARI